MNKQIVDDDDKIVMDGIRLKRKLQRAITIAANQRGILEGRIVSKNEIMVEALTEKFLPNLSR